MVDTQEIVDRFPEFAELLKIPEIAAVVQEAGAGNFSQSMFQSKLWGTDWWKTTPQTAWKWQALKLNDPATAGQTAGNMSTKVHSLALQMGINLNPSQIVYFSEVGIGQGWDDQTLQHKIVDFGANQKLMPGQIKATQSQLLATASNYGINMGWGTAEHWATGIADGTRTAEGYEEYVREKAKTMYPPLAKELDNGMTVKQIADPYVQIAGQTLGINPDTIQLTDPKWQRALMSRNSKGEIVGPMTTLDWQRTLMTDKAYDYQHSENGQKAAAQLRGSLAEEFGIGA